MITLFGKRGLVALFSLAYRLFAVSCGLFTLPLGVIGGCSVIVVLSGRILFYSYKSLFHR